MEQQKVFNNGNERDGREILIIIDDEWILFYFFEQYERQRDWIATEEQRRYEYGEEPLDEDEYGNHEFYSIPKHEWKKDYPRWQDHMKHKAWFTQEMENFMNINT